MVSGINGGLLLVLALLPGACSAWAFQRCAPRYGNRLRDWLLRLVGLSAVFAATGSWPIYWAYANYWDRLAAGDALPRALAILPAAYLVIPTVAGWWLGKAVQRSAPWATTLVGRNRAPRAWDHLFARRSAALIRCRMRSGRWLGGVFEAKSASAYGSGDAPDQDLYIERAVHLNPASGAVCRRADGELDWANAGILLKWSDIEYLAYTELDDKDTKED